MSDSTAIGIIGMGFMGRMHAGAYQACDGARLAAVADGNPSRRAGKAEPMGNLPTPEEAIFDASLVRGYETPQELLADPEIEAVSICTPTDTHVELAITALQAGKHVLVEKPVALRSADIERLIEVAKRSDRVCMPAMCIRFWPGWSWLKRTLDAGDLGRPKSAVFRRVGAPPSWSRSFYADRERSGGALVDLHIHDVDFVRWCFGQPTGVHAVGTRNHVITSYDFEAGPAGVTIEGGWLPGMPFSMSFVVAFEDTTVDYDLGRDPALVLRRDGEEKSVHLEDGDGYGFEIEHFLACIRDGTPPAVTLDDALAVTRLLEEEARQIDARAR